VASDSIQVQVRLFATLRQEAGWSERTVTLPPGATVAELLTQLETTTPGLKLSGRAVYAAVNQQYTRGTQALADGDVVAIFPPVSGGVR
jgi:molybdopterin converting factor subunit 1